MDRGTGAGVLGGAALAFLALLAAGAFAGLASTGLSDPSSAAAAFDARTLRVARFTLWQAALSTVVSVLPAILLARALHRHPRFPGRSLILRLFALPLALPAIVAALAILALYGRAGAAAPVLAWLTGQSWGGIYGLSGILVAHAFFNLPLATRFLLAALDAVPENQWRLAGQLGMGSFAMFRFIEWPALRSALPGTAALVFLLCASSFTIVLTLGGGPAATTLEVAIYQSLRFDFDPPRALALTMLQLSLTGIVVMLLRVLGVDAAADSSFPARAGYRPRTGSTETTFNASIIVVAALFVIAPLVAIVAAGLDSQMARLVRDPAVHRATITSVFLASAAAVLAITLSFAIVSARWRVAGRRRKDRSTSFLERAFDSGPVLILVVPPIVIGAGWFVLIRQVGDVFAAAPWVVLTVNAAMAVPFAIRMLRPAHDSAAARHDRLCAQLGITGWNRLRLVDAPALARPLAAAAAFSVALSMGDLGVIALFGSDSVQTLPYLLLQRMGSYRTADAAGLALLLTAMCFLLVMLAESIGRNRHE